MMRIALIQPLLSLIPGFTGKMIMCSSAFPVGFP